MPKKKTIAMILAGGQGTRLGALTKNLAKPAVPFGGKYRIIDLHSNGFIERISDANGNEFYTTRTTEGYYYITDIRFFGELVVSMPSYQFVIHSIDY